MSTGEMSAKADHRLILDIRSGLGGKGQKELHSQYFYDALGSALFDVITLLPEYGLARAGERLLERHAFDLSKRLNQKVLVTELGSGSGTKTQWVLRALTERKPVTYLPIDISDAALKRCKLKLEQLDGVDVQPLECDYIEGLRQVMVRRPRGFQLLVLFLGGTIGNFGRPMAIEFLRQLRQFLESGDILYLGTDLEKPIPQVLAAYNDSIGVTAAFNLNILARMNRELGADFDLNQFAHVAIYNKEARRIEMYLRSKRKQKVAIPGADLTLNLLANETIWTESSHKFNCKEVIEMGRVSGFRCDIQWVDKEWPFAQSVLVAE